jgi:hypothetical protein
MVQPGMGRQKEDSWIEIKVVNCKKRRHIRNFIHHPTWNGSDVTRRRKVSLEV